MEQLFIKKTVMKYKPVRIEGNVNVPKHNHLFEFFYLIIIALLLVLTIYFIAGVAVDYIIDHYPEQADSAIGKIYSKAFRDPKRDKVELYLQNMADDLSGDKGKFYVRVLNSPAVNAAAIPGGTILIFSGLIDSAQSDNEVAFIIGHEIGHFNNRDHLRKFGRLMVMVIGLVVLRDGNTANNFILKQVQNADMRYSQQQELAADRYGLDSINRAYGHVGGSTDFFDRLGQLTTDSRWAYLFATHPHPKKRSETLNELINFLEYKKEQTSPKFTIYNTPTTD
jgi:predicted Zn-dependent protease